MAKYSGAEWHPLPENATQGRITPDQFIIHTAVDGKGPSNIPGYFARSSVRVESHFWLTNNARLVQMMDSNIRADANLKANGRAISIETEDDGDPEKNPWSPGMVDRLVELILWAHEEHDIPLEVCPAWNKPGIGWHSMWGYEDGVNLKGRILQNPWTSSRGKTCPGRTRIGQIMDEIMPRLQAPQPQPKPAPAVQKTGFTLTDRRQNDRWRASANKINDLEKRVTALESGRSKIDL